MFSCCGRCVLSGRGLCDELITRQEKSYRLWCVVVCDLETSWMRRPWPTEGCCAKKKICTCQGTIGICTLTLFQLFRPVVASGPIGPIPFLSPHNWKQKQLPKYCWFQKLGR